MKKVKSFFNMKKLVLGALACAALVLMMPGEAKAAAWSFDSNNSGVNADGYNWTYKNGVDASNPATWHVLELNGINHVVSGTYGMKCLPTRKLCLMVVIQ